MRVNETVRVRLKGLYEAARQSQDKFDACYATALESLDCDPRLAYQLNLDTGEVTAPPVEETA